MTQAGNHYPLGIEIAGCVCVGFIGIGEAAVTPAGVASVGQTGLDMCARKTMGSATQARNARVISTHPRERSAVRHVACGVQGAVHWHPRIYHRSSTVAGAMWAHGRRRGSRDGAGRGSAGVCVCGLQVARSGWASWFFRSHGVHGVEAARAARRQGERGLAKLLVRKRNFGEG